MKKKMSRRMSQVIAVLLSALMLFSMTGLYAFAQESSGSASQHSQGVFGGSMSLTDTTYSDTAVRSASVTYYGNGGKIPGGTPGNLYSVDDLIAGDPYTVLGNDTIGFVREGYTFTGWKWGNPSSGTTFQSGDTMVLAGNDSLHAEWKLNPSTMTVQADNVSKTYNGISSGVSATASLATATIRYYNTSTGAYDLVVSPTFTDAGTYTVQFKATATGYSDAYGQATVTIAPATLTVTADDKTRAYGTNNSTLAYSSTVTGFVGTEHATLTGAQYACSVGQYANAGTYVDAIGVSNALLADGTSSGYKVGNYTLTYAPGNLTVTSIGSVTVTANNKTKIYGQSDPDLTATVTGAPAGSINYTLSRVPGENVGEYDIVVTLGSNPNYTVATTDATFTITPATLTVDPTDTGKTFGQTDPTLAAGITGLTNGDAIDDVLAYTVARASGENVGTYAMSIANKTEKSDNYTYVYETGVFSITPASASVTASNKTKVYGQSDPDLTATVTGASAGSINYTLSRQPGNNVGEYDIVVTLGSNPNYTVAKTDATFTITPATLTVDPTDTGKIFGQTDPTLAAGITGLTNGDAIDDVLAYTVTRASGENVGTYAMSIANKTEKSDNYTYVYETGVFSIAPASASVTASNKTKVYGQSDPDLTATVTGAPAGSINYTLSRVPGENVGEYEIVVTLESNPNYTVATTDATFTVTPASVVITAQNAGKVKGAEDPALSAAVTGLIGSDSIVYTVERIPGEAVGTYAITVAYTANPNYNVTKVSGVFTITAASSPVVPATPATPATPTTPATPATPATPQSTPPAATTTTQAPAAQAPSAPTTTIADDPVPLASVDSDSCWVHWAILFCMFLTIVYVLITILRRIKMIEDAKLHAKRKSDAVSRQTATVEEK